MAEAGVDAGMLALKLDWPRHDCGRGHCGQRSAQDRPSKRTPSGLWDPSRSTPSEFIQVSLYDNVDSDAGTTTTVADPDAPKWDSNGDGMMFVDSTSQRRRRPPPHPHPGRAAEMGAHLPGFNLALWATTVDSNGQGLEIKIEDGTPPIYYDVHDVRAQGHRPQDGGAADASPSTDSTSVFARWPWSDALAEIAKGRNTYFDGADAVAQAEAALSTGRGERQGRLHQVRLSRRDRGQHPDRHRGRSGRGGHRHARRLREHLGHEGYRRLLRHPGQRSATALCAAPAASTAPCTARAR